MMLIRVLMVIQLIGVLSVYAQERYESCPIDTTMELELTILISALEPNGDSIIVQSSVKRLDSVNCSPYHFDWKSFKVFDANKNNAIDCKPNQITSLKIELYQLFSSSYVFELDTFECLNSMGLPNLKKLLINGGPYCKMRFGTWQLYEELLSSQSLKTISVGSEVVNTDWFAPFLELKGIRELSINDHLSFELGEFDSLEKLDILNMYSLFSHFCVKQIGLIEMPSLESASVRNTDLHPQVYFISNYFSPNVMGHPFKQTNDAIQTKLKEIPNYTGSFAVTYGDMFGAGSVRENDTIAIGKVKNGRSVGVWRYLLPQFQAFDKKWYYYSYSNLNFPPFPSEGEWSINYPDGTLAISGYFKDDKKHGVWKFYDPDGKISNVMYFNEGKPSGLYTGITVQDDIEHEARIYFFDPNYSITGSKIANNKYVMISLKSPGYPGGQYNLDSYGNLIEFDEGVLIGSIPKNSRKYKKVLKKFLKKLFPEKRLSIEQVIFLG